MPHKKPKRSKWLEISTLGELTDSGYQPVSVKEELRRNLITKKRSGEKLFEGIWGYEDTVIPDVERAILSRHNINFLGLRGQAKTRMARMMTDLLDEYIPIVKDAPLNDDPTRPISEYARRMVMEKGHDTPITWLCRHERYTEKLATPDVTIADLIGDVDPIKAASLKLPYSDERVIHFGLVPRSHRGLFVLNELPDLQARIQVALFNILQEGDIQIRGFKLQIPLDIQFVFTANPEDYTNRGAIVTPLKDRIGSQIITHYPDSIEVAKKITQQEAAIKNEQKGKVEVFELAKDMIEQIAMEARKSEYVDEKSGVSARLTISGYENLVSAAERRTLINGDKKTNVRVTDFQGVIPSITGKVELVYEGEQEGAGIVANNLVGKAIRTQFINYFPSPEKERKGANGNIYAPIKGWFEKGNKIDLLFDAPESDYRKTLQSVQGLEKLIDKYQKTRHVGLKYFLMEFALFGLAEYSLLSKHQLINSTQFKDLFTSMFSMPELGDN